MAIGAAGMEGVSMQYLLLIYGPEADFSQVSAEDMALEMKAWNAYTEWLQGKGWMLGGEALQPVATATRSAAEPCGVDNDDSA